MLLLADTDVLRWFAYLLFDLKLLLGPSLIRFGRVPDREQETLLDLLPDLSLLRLSL